MSQSYIRSIKKLPIKMKWICKNYNELSTIELYEILKIRQEVFIIEQNCNYLDADGYDKQSKHLFAFQHDQIIAYMRIVNAGLIYNNVSFGRILVRKEYRQQGIGKKIIKKGLSLFSTNETIVMSAQVYLKKFYQDFGFICVGPEYLEDDIVHVKMVRNG